LFSISDGAAARIARGPGPSRMALWCRQVRTPSAAIAITSPAGRASRVVSASQTVEPDDTPLKIAPPQAGGRFLHAQVVRRSTVRPEMAEGPRIHWCFRVAAPLPFRRHDATTKKPTCDGAGKARRAERRTSPGRKIERPTATADCSPGCNRTLERRLGHSLFSTASRRSLRHQSSLHCVCM
jgi:hypothetical protein